MGVEKTYVGSRRKLSAADWRALGWAPAQSTRLAALDRTEASVVVVSEDGVGPLYHHVRHSPSGFEWGYAGSGPAELARCILIDHFGLAAPWSVREHHDDVFFVETDHERVGPYPCCEAHQECARLNEQELELPVSYERFKVAFIARLPQGEPWSLSSGEIDAWIADAGASRARGH